MAQKSIIVEEILESALEFLEDKSLENLRLRSKNYQVIKEALEDGAPIAGNIIDRILAICVQSMNEDIKYAVLVLDIMSVILKKIKAGEYSKMPNLGPSALAIINLINKTDLLPKVYSLKLLCMETLLLYPDEVFINMATVHCDELMELLKLEGHAWTTNDFSFLIIDMLIKLLSILPPDKKADFVKSGLSTWFSKIVPAIINLLIHSCNTGPLEALELLTAELVKFDYTENSHWKTFFESNICDAKRYPETMKSLLLKGSPIWHRIWIVFIRMLNNQITRNTSSVGTPINSMLPVVETAFKMDPVNRCRAFQCWSVLIDIFCNETNENCVNKRLKLLIIPLKLNNAKVEETALAKFDSWWHLITKFQNRLDKFVDTVLISFLHFCFGKHTASGKSTFIPGQISDSSERLCVQAFVEIVGHVNCEGCTEIPHLKRKLLTTKYLVEHWNDWTYSLKSVIRLSATNISTPQQVKCLWMSFLLTIGELPDNNIRRDLFNELLAVLSLLTQNCKSDDTLGDVVFNVLILSLFDEETKIKQLLKSKSKENCTINRIVTIVRDPALKHFYQRFSAKELVTKLKPISNFIVEESLNPAKNVLKWILEVLPSNDVTLKLWTALTESVCESERVISKSSLCDMLLWPLHSMNLFTDVNIPARAWYTMYNLMITNLNETGLENTISSMLMSSNVVTNSSTYFTLCVTLAILKNGLVMKISNIGYENEAKLFHTLIDRIDCYDNIKEVFPMIVDTLVVMVNNATDVLNENLAQHTVTTVKNLLKLMTPVIKQKPDNDNTLTVLETLFKSLGAFFKIESYSKLLPVLADELIHYSTLFDESLRNLNLQIPSAETHDKNTKNNIELVTGDVILDASDRNIDKSKFSTPNTKASKKNKRKGTNIVNTVVENGEEFVVVKSNWKFNPRNLTENQKEKLQRKREDIPALYQDLSQSQDEYKLTVWKADSQDTITTSKSSSKSMNEGADATLILKNFPNNDVLPKIMENILSEKDKESDKTKKSSQVGDINNSKPLTPRTPKTPRMALKDRVFRNMRNLIEKSNPKVGIDEEPNQIENIPKTPQATKPKTDAANIINSAPSLLVAERPSRVKRKPKKFDDLEIFELKKRRHSQNDSQPDIEIADSCTTNPIDKDEPLADIVQLPQNEIPNCIDTHERSDVSEKTENIELNRNAGPESNIEDAHTPEKDTRNGEINQIDIGDRNDPTNMEVESKGIEHTCSVEKEPNGGGSCELDINKINNSEITTPKQFPNVQEIVDQGSSVKKNKVKKSRIEKELAIDMVEGHPFLNTPSSSDKRSTRKNISSPITSIRRKKLIDKLNKSKVFTETSFKNELKENNTIVDKESMSVTVNETEDRVCNLSQNIPCSEDPCSEDIIESSQDSTLTTITVIKKTPKKIPIVSIEKIEINVNSNENISETQNLLQDQDCEIVDFPDSLPVETRTESKNELNIFEEDVLQEKPQEMDADVEITKQGMHCEIVTLPDSSLNNQESKDDIELPRNETVVDDKNETELTADMDTQSIRDKDISDDVIIINDEEEPPIPISSEEPGLGTQELANADTQPIDTSDFLVTKTDVVAIIHDDPKKFESVTVVQKEKDINISSAHCTTQDDTTKTISESMNLSAIDNTSDLSSPFKDDDQRKQDFLNNTVEISPIKTLSPDREKISPSPETSGDYVVITLSSPVHSNGEPFEKGSPEFFTNDKISPDKRDQSPPRVELSVTNTSPSSSLSLKKNRPQVRAGGRAAQMLGLCVPETLQTILNADRSEPEEGKKTSPTNTQARRNLRILYNSVGDISDNPSENEDSEHFLRLRRSLPAVDLSPAGPILKRKLAEITDDATVSPANKRKRVSFHDPPVSTTVSVQKYIEPYGVRSPQSSAQKRLEKQMRPQMNMKSPKRLDSVFKLDSALTKAVESFTEIDIIVTNDDDTQISPLDQTPAVEIVKTSELNDIDPFCPELLDCKDPIVNIAAELSSPAMKSLFVNVFADKIVTVGDLAKMTELEVNRLCIKAPKVEVAKRVLSDYASKIGRDNIVTNNEVASDVDVHVAEILDTSVNIEVQTDDVLSSDAEIQTVTIPSMLASTQTETVCLVHTDVQTEESGSNSTAHIIASCLKERPDFVDQLGEQLEESSIRQLTEKLSFNTISDMLMKQTTSTNSNIVLNRLLEHPSIQESSEQNKELSFLRDYLCNKFDSKDLILFCSQLLQKVYDKPA